MKKVTLRRSSEAAHGLGFSIRGGKELSVGIYVSKIEPNSAADKAGIKPGDQVISVNGISFESISHDEAIRMLKSLNTVHMTLMSTGHFPSACFVHQTHTWVDCTGRSVSPPKQLEGSKSRSTPTRGLSVMSREDRVRKVIISLEEHDNLGLMIRGGTEYGLGIYVTGVESGSAAERASLKMGDQIIEVNNLSFDDITHDEAVRILKHSCKHLVMLVRDVGKVPFTCTTYDEVHWVPGTEGQQQTGRRMARESKLKDTSFLTMDPQALEILDEKARLLLTKKEMATLTYYRKEYERGQMTLDSFVAVLLELLQSVDKFSLLTEMREVLLLRDQEKFDDLIYNREVEMKKTCQKVGSSSELLAADRASKKSKKEVTRTPSRERGRRNDSGGGGGPTVQFADAMEQKKTVRCICEDCCHATPGRRMYHASGSMVGLDANDAEEARTPSEDSGVEMPNGTGTSSFRLPSFQKL